MTQTGQQNLTLTVSRRYRATRERVFDAWTNPEIMKQWFSPEGVTNPDIQVDLRVGGAYRVEMLTPDGRRPVAVGTYQEITRPERLVFTWAWEDETDDAHTGQTLVTVEFLKHGDGTDVVVSHEGFPAEEGRKGHEDGWTSSLVCLESVLSEE